jgi:exopolyphosphatase / guanosine-5'-triphosphate,3'-diphosphate pyrophosphatase
LKYAAIDVGSNAVRLLIADLVMKGPEIISKKNTLVRVPLRLGDDAFLNKKLSDKKMSDLVKTFIAFRHLMDVYKVTDYMACATSAMRESVNGPEAVERIRKEAQIDLEIVEGGKEASIIYSSHIEQHLDKKKCYLYIDVGGGSTELSIFSGQELKASRSFDIGTIRMLDNQDKEETWKDMKDWIRQNTRTIKNPIGIGTGGNINKLFKMSQEKEGTALSFIKLRALYNYLNSYSLKERITVLGLNEDRADVILPASEIYLTVMKWAGVKSIYVPKIGLVDGIIQLLVEKHQHEFR